MPSTLEILKSSYWLRFLTSLILFAIGILFVVGQPFVAKLSGYKALSNQSAALLDQRMEDNQRTFLVFSAIKASLALIEGSTVGVGVEVQVGDLIQPAYDYVDFFWNVFLMAFVIMGFYKILLETGMLTLGFPLVGIGFLIWAISMMVPTQRWQARTLTRKLMLFGVLITHALPLSLLASDQLGQFYVEALKVQHQNSITNFELQLGTTRTKFLAVKEEISLFSPSDSLEKVESGLITLAQSIGTAFQATFLSFMYYVLILLFELLILPFCTAFLLYLFGRRLMEGIVAPQKAQPAPVTITQV